MNIFYLDPDPYQAARYLCDKHVVKMCLESAQLLSTAHRELDGEQCDGRLYRSTHKNHPSSVWCRSGIHNYRWLFDHFDGIAREYTRRYQKVHLSYEKLNDILFNPPQNVPMELYSEPPQCMPEEYKNDDTVTAYRNYYIGDKLRFAKWTNRKQPEWINETT